MPDRPNMRSHRSKAVFGSRTDVGCVRDHNEDTLIVVPPLFAVADGMGGHAAGEVASEIAVRTLEELAPTTADSETLSKAVCAANLAVMEAAQEKGRQGMGTTLTAAILEGERLVIAQVGDSRAYILHNGHLQQITRDHSLMAELIEAGEITEDEARVHPQRSVITRALGSDPNMQPDIYEINVRAGDRLLLCSDGLTTMLDDSEVQRTMMHHRDPQHCASALVNEAISQGGLDNITVIVVDIEGNAAREARKMQVKGRAWAIVIVLAILLAIFGILFGVYNYTQSTAYLIEENGMVCVYKGVPASFMGINLSTLDRKTTIEVDDLQPGVAKRLKEGPIRVESMEEAEALLAEYEKGILEDQEKES